MADLYAHQAPHLTSPIEHLAAVTPNDSADLANFSRTLFVGVSGDVTCDTVGGEEAITLKNVAAGMHHPIRLKRIDATGTTATDIVVGW
jgi:hypothetical protein